MKKINKFYILIIVAITILIAFKYNSKTNNHSETNKVEYLVKMDICNSIFINGKIYPSEEMDILTNTTGYIKITKVKIGDKVNIGDVLFEIEEFDNKKSVIKSTMKGVVTSINQSTGSKINNTSFDIPIIASIGNFDHLVYKSYIEEKYLSFINIGDKIELQIDALNNLNTSSRITSISIKPVMINNEYLYEVKSIIENNPNEIEKFIYGFNARGKVILESEKNIFAIKENYIQYINNKPFVKVRKSNGETSFQKVKLGISNGIFIQIKCGLSKKDKIILWLN